jgi:hypothetical protein
MSYERAWVVGVFGRAMVKRTGREEDFIGKRVAAGSKLDLHTLVRFAGLEGLRRPSQYGLFPFERVRHENRIVH